MPARAGYDRAYRQRKRGIYVLAGVCVAFFVVVISTCYIAAAKYGYGTGFGDGHELDGSGTVGTSIRAPQTLVPGARFTTEMRMFGATYRITSTITTMKPDELIEWRHPVLHHWRWEFAAITPTITCVTATFDYRDTGPLKDWLKYYERTGFAKRNAAGIEATLTKLRNRYGR